MIYGIIILNGNHKNKSLKFNYFKIFIFINIFLIKSIYSDFHIFVFDSHNYRYGAIAINSNGDMIAEYSKGNYRIFFGLKKNGDYYFKNNNYIREFEVDGSGTNLNRYESRSVFINTNDPNDNKQYLFNMARMRSVTELYDLDSDDNYYIYKQHSEILGDLLFSFAFSLFELSNNEYLITYEQVNYLYLKKLSFSSYSLEVSVQSNDNPIYTECYHSMSSSFKMSSIIVLFYLNSAPNYVISIYDYNLNLLNTDLLIDSITHNNEVLYHIKVFFKCLYLTENLGAFIYFQSILSGDSLRLKIGNIDKDTDNNYIFTEKLTKEINEYSFQTDTLLNDFIKVNDKRYIFISLREPATTTITILLIDFYNEYKNMKIRVYEPNLNDKYQINTEFTADIFNGLLVFSSTVNIVDNSDQISILMIFGYPNGTDSTLDISDYFMDDIIDNTNNIVTKLQENFIFENNIFGYEIVEKIKLITIPDEILFYNANDEGTKLSNGDILNKEYILKQNEDLDKNNEYYYLEFQFITQEPDYITFNSKAENIIDYPSSSSDEYVDQSTYYEYKTFYGKKISIKFKLCHEFCSTCKKIGTTINDQKCLTCLEDYQYFYEGDSSNCVQEGYFIDKEENILVECTSSNSKYYTDLETNKRICFKNTYSCPESNPYYNILTNECQNNPIPTTIITTIPTTIITTIPTTIITNIPKTIITTIPTTEINKVPTTSSISTFKCEYNDLINMFCSFLNYNNLEIYSKIISELIKEYPNNGTSVVIEGEDNYAFQLTTSENEKKTINGEYDNNYNLSMIDLGDCEDLLKKENNIDEDTELIILKYEKMTNVAYEKNVQYEVFDPIEKKKLDLSICQTTSIDIYIPVTLSEKTQSLYKDLQEYGYDLFDPNGSFYQEVCTPYKSENGTDVLLSDRRKDFYDNETMCQPNCHYSSFISETQLLKCECDIDVEEIDVENTEEKFDEKMIYGSFYDVLKYSNFKVLKCYELVFQKKTVSKNYGSLVVMIIFAIYLVFLFIYIVLGILPIQKEVANQLFVKPQSQKNIKISIFSNNSNEDKTINTKEKTNEPKPNNKRKKTRKSKTKKSIKLSFPPKKRPMTVRYNLIKDIKINKDSINIQNSNKKKSNNNNRNKLKSKTKINLINTKSDNNAITTKKNNYISSNRKFSDFSVSNISMSPKESNNINENELAKKKKFDDFELNDLDYEEALLYDKRSFCKIYWSILRREHIIILIFTFFIRNDYNLPYIKFSRFIFLLCTDMAMNVIFFTDDSMHEVYLSYGKYDFFQQIPQIIYSTIISQLLEVFLCYLSLTDKHIYQIKYLKANSENRKLIFKILRLIKIKLIVFFIFTSVLFAFYWYFISAFCAVYTNTQGIFIKDSLSSFLTGQIYPFILYFFPSILRLIALKDSKKKRFNIIYKLSDIIPIF